jgi:hypothetical protein
LAGWRCSGATPAPAGGVLLAAVYLVFALGWLPRIVAGPLTYDHWGNFFEQYSLVSGALIVVAAAPAPAGWAERLTRFAYASFGICVVSFTLEQAFYLSDTAGFVPKWIPAGQMFWAVTTTLAFALAAIALLTGRQALLASRLLTLMIVMFGLLVWLPMLIANPHDQMNWGGNCQNLGIAGAAWIVADLLERRKV